MNYAGFFVRSIAFLIDISILWLFFKFLKYIIGDGLPPLFILLISLFVFWAYYALSIYKWHTTIGKLILGLRVYSINLKPVTLLQATGRTAVALIVYTLISLLPNIFSQLRLYITPLFDWGTYVIFGVISLPIMMIFFNRHKQVLHDWIAKTVVIDMHKDQKTPQKDQETRSPGKRPSKVVSGIRVFGTVVVLSGVAFFIYYFGTFFFVMGSYALHQQKQYDASFRTYYPVNDYNDSRIIFYKKELDKASKAFVHADGMYDIFAADTQRDLAINCIEHFLQERNVSEWIDAGSNFYKHYRNKYANTPELIAKAKHNENYLGKHFYDYDMNEVNHIEEEIASPWDKEINRNTCDALMPVSKMFDEIFIPKYIANREAALLQDKQNLKNAPRHGVLDKSFYRGSIKTGEYWLGLLYDHFPKLLEAKKEAERALERFRQQALKEAQEAEIRQEKMIQEKYKEAKKKGQSPLFVALLYRKYDDLKSMLDSGENIQVRNHAGWSPLFYALRDKRAMEILLEYGANPNSIGPNKIYTPFTEMLNSAHVDIETVNMFLEHGADVNFQYNKSETPLTIAAKGCKKFDVVSLLLKNGANPNLKDRFGYTTKTGLFRYCTDKKDLEKMLKIIEDEE